MRVRSSILMMGLQRKSSAPSSIALCTDGGSVSAVTITIGTSLPPGSARSLRKTSKPSMRGMTSSSMTSDARRAVPAALKRGFREESVRGVVVDHEDGRAVPRVVGRSFDPDHSALLECASICKTIKHSTTWSGEIKNVTSERVVRTMC
jgi:hypothetical protein